MLETKYYIQNGKYKKASRHFDRSQIVFSGSAFLSLFLSKNLKMNEETTKQSADSSVLILTIDFQEFFSDLFPWERSRGIWLCLPMMCFTTLFFLTYLDKLNKCGMFNLFDSYDKRVNNTVHLWSF